MELSLVVLDNKNALKIGIFLFAGGRGGRSLVEWFGGLLLRFQVIFVAHGERLDGNGDRIVLHAGGDFGRGGESGTQVVRRIKQRNYDLEILGFLAAGDAL